MSLIMPAEFFGEVRSKTEFTKTAPRVWTRAEEAWVLDRLGDGFTVSEIAEAVGRTEVSVQIKLKRLSKSSDRYNVKHRDLKYAANQMFVDALGVRSVLDVYAGDSFYKGAGVESVVDNDVDGKFDTEYSVDALKLLCLMYFEGRRFDVVDLDPYGSAYECFDLAVKLAKRGVVVSFGEWGHRRWKRLDFVRHRYSIDSLDAFVEDAFVAEFQRIALLNHRTAEVFDVLRYGNFLRVYFKLGSFKTTEQWEK